MIPLMSAVRMGSDPGNSSTSTAATHLSSTSSTSAGQATTKAASTPSVYDYYIGFEGARLHCKPHIMKESKQLVPAGRKWAGTAACCCCFSERGEHQPLLPMCAAQTARFYRKVEGSKHFRLLRELGRGCERCKETSKGRLETHWHTDQQTIKCRQNRFWVRHHKNSPKNWSRYHGKNHAPESVISRRNHVKQAKFTPNHAIFSLIFNPIKIMFSKLHDLCSKGPKSISEPDKFQL